ncbi:transglycosylase family protein [Candidatus Microgenomates bacterium]|nr:transglycosylase family protein [Candidatus Microgenomates bacterium]
MEDQPNSNWFARGHRCKLAVAGSRRKLSFWANHRRGLALLIGLILAVSLVAIIKSDVQAQDSTVISLSVDGERQGFSTDAKTVADVLARAKVRISRDDLVEPSLDTVITTQIFYINVYRAKPAIVEDQGRTVKVYTPYQNPKLIAERSAGLALFPEDDFEAELIRDFVGAESVGHKIKVKRAVPVFVEVDGRTLELRSLKPTVGVMLEEKGIVLGPEDQVNVDRNAALSTGMRIAITRVGKQVIVAEEIIPSPIETIFDNNKPPGSEEIRQAGASGKKLVTYQVEYQNGVEVKREVLQTVVVEQPVTKVVVRGVSHSGGVWEALRNCESGGDYSKNTGNGFYGAYQFSAGTWRSMGTGYEYAHQAPSDVQDSAAQRLQARAGWGQWPACARRLGLY